MTRPNGKGVTLTLMATLAAVTPAHAHVVASRLGDFYTGALHPLTDLQEVVVWVALAALAGLMGDNRGRTLTVLFPLGLLVGLALGLRLGPLPMAALLGAAPMVALGLLIGLAARMPGWLVGALGLIVGLSRGAASVSGLAPDTDRLLFAAGLAAVGYAVVTLTIAATLAFVGAGARTAPLTSAGRVGGWRAIAVRACGSWVAAIGLMLAALAR